MKGFMQTTEPAIVNFTLQIKLDLLAKLRILFSRSVNVHCQVTCKENKVTPIKVHAELFVSNKKIPLERK